MKKICLSTVLCDLYGKDNYKDHIEIGREYWGFFPVSDNIKYSGWYKIKITYIRSNCVFYIFSDHPEIPEDFCGINSFLMSRIEFAELDPEKDLKLDNVEMMKKVYYFDDTRTIVHNWPEDKEMDISIEEKYLCLFL